jgi:uncharacterized protein (TIGR03435 family)
MLQATLDDRFNLKLRREMREMPVYVLSIGNDGPKLTPWKEGDGLGQWTSVGGYDDLKNGIAPPKSYSGLRVGVIGASRASMRDLASQLALMTHRPVLDRTDLSGYFNYEFFFAPGNYRLRRSGDTRPDLSSPSLFKVLEDELGLKLEAAREKVEVLLIDNVEMPSEN